MEFFWEKKKNNLTIIWFIDLTRVINYISEIIKTSNQPQGKIEELIKYNTYYNKINNQPIDSSEIYQIMIAITKQLSLVYHDHKHKGLEFPEVHGHIFKKNQKTTIKITINPDSGQVFAEKHGGDVVLELDEISSNKKKKAILEAAKKIFTKKIKSLPSSMFAKPSKNSICLGNIT